MAPKKTSRDVFMSISSRSAKASRYVARTLALRFFDSSRHVSLTGVARGFSRASPSRDDLRNRDPVDVRQSHVAAVVPVGQLLVIDTEQIKDRRMQIVIRGRLLLGLVAELVARADRLSALDAGARHPHRHRARIVIASDAAL